MPFACFLTFKVMTLSFKNFFQGLAPTINFVEQKYYIEFCKIFCINALIEIK